MSRPGLPAPCPDEILGSWVARLCLYNTPRAWHALAERHGVNRIRGEFFDIIEYTEGRQRLFEALGTTYLELVSRLTTYAYWLRLTALQPPEQCSTVMTRWRKLDTQSA